MKLQLVGEDYSARSIASQLATCINLYPELIDGVTAKGQLTASAQGKNYGTLYGCPGRTQLAALGHTNIRALFSVNGRAWCVNGTDLVEFGNTGTVISRKGTVIDDGLPAQILVNSQGQVLVISGGRVYLDNGGGSLISQTFVASTGTVDTFTYNGRVNTSGTTVNWESGNTFLPGSFWVGGTIFINSLTYTVATVVSPIQLTVTTSTGTLTNVVYADTSGQGVKWDSGDQFVTDGTWIGKTITFSGGFTSTIEAVIDSETMYVVGAGGGTGVSYSVAGANVNASWGCYLDGYFIVVVPNSQKFSICGLNDGSSWSQLDFGLKESYPDNIISVLSANEQLYIFGTESIEVWQNTGGTTANPFPFSRISGSVSRFGAVSAWTQVALDGNVYFLGGDGSGNIRAYVLNGWSPVPVSTPAQEAYWASSTFNLDAIGFGYLEEGHSFYMLSSSTTGKCLAYDQNTGCWHQRNRWNGSAFTYNNTEFHCFAYKPDGTWGNGTHFVADRTSGTIYQQSLSILLDNGSSWKWQRTLPYIYQENQRFIYGRFTLEMETGVYGSGTPTVQLSWSDDRGETFRGNLSAPIGTAGAYTQRVYWTRTGGLSGAGGMSRGRNYQLSGIVSSPGYKVALVDADVDVKVCG